MNVLDLRSVAPASDELRRCVSDFVRAIDREDVLSGARLTTEPFALRGQRLPSFCESTLSWLRDGSEIRLHELHTFERMELGLFNVELEVFTGTSLTPCDTIGLCDVAVGGVRVHWGIVVRRHRRHFLVHALYNPLPMVDWMWRLHQQRSRVPS